MRGMGYYSLRVSFVPRPSAGADIILYLGCASLFNTLKCWESQSSLNLHTRHRN
jgi:hypothetical protein